MVLTDSKFDYDVYKKAYEASLKKQLLVQHVLRVSLLNVINARLNNYTIKALVFNFLKENDQKESFILDSNALIHVMNQNSNQLYLTFDAFASFALNNNVVTREIALSYWKQLPKLDGVNMIDLSDYYIASMSVQLELLGYKVAQQDNQNSSGLTLKISQRHE